MYIVEAGYPAIEERNIGMDVQGVNAQMYLGRDVVKFSLAESFQLSTAHAGENLINDCVFIR